MSFFLMFYLFKEFDFVFFLCNLVMIIFATLIILIYLLLPHFLKQKYKLSEFLKIDFEKLIKNCNIDFKKEEIKKILLCQNTRYCKLYEEYAFLTSLVTDYKKNSYVAILEKIIKFNDKVKLLNHRYNAIIYKLSLYLYFDLQKIHKNALN
jgi:hypothetical protein